MFGLKCGLEAYVWIKMWIVCLCLDSNVDWRLMFGLKCGLEAYVWIKVWIGDLCLD